MDTCCEAVPPAPLHLIPGLVRSADIPCGGVLKDEPRARTTQTDFRDFRGFCFHLSHGNIMISLFHRHRCFYHRLTGRKYRRAALDSDFVTSRFQLGIANPSGLV